MSEDQTKEALKMMPYGFYAISSRNEEEQNVMVANWVMQSSFEPRQVVAGIQKTSFSHGILEKDGSFVIHLFHKENSDAIRPFTKGRAKNPEKFANAEYTPGPVTGAPVLAGAAGYIECRVLQILDTGGDHSLVVGEVVGGAVLREMDASEALSLPQLGWSYAG